MFQTVFDQLFSFNSIVYHKHITTYIFHWVHWSYLNIYDNCTFHRTDELTTHPLLLLNIEFCSLCKFKLDTINININYLRHNLFEKKVGLITPRLMLWKLLAITYR